MFNFDVTNYTEFLNCYHKQLQKDTIEIIEWRSIHSLGTFLFKRHQAKLFIKYSCTKYCNLTSWDLGTGIFVYIMSYSIYYFILKSFNVTVLFILLFNILPAHILPQHWIFGGLCHKTNDCFLVVIPDNSAKF